MLRMVAELMVLLRLALDMIQVTRKLFLHRDHPVLAMAKRAATEVDAEASDRDRSPRGRRGNSMPAVTKAPSPASLAPAVSTRLEGQIAELTRGLQMMSTQLQTLASVVENQQQAAANAKSQSAIQMQQVMIQGLQAQRTALPISPRGVSRPPSPSRVHARSSPFGAANMSGGQPNGASPFGIGQTTSNVEAQPTASSRNVGSTSADMPKIVLPGGIEIPLGVPSTGVTTSATTAGTGGTTDKPATLDALQRSDKWLPEMPSVDAKGWRTRTEEIIGFETFMENFTAWIGLVSAAFANEVRFAITSPSIIDATMLSEDQKARGVRLLNMLKQVFREVPKAKMILLAYNESSHSGERNGFEALSLIAHEYLARSRQEVMHFRNSLLGKTFKANSITELIKQMEFEESRYLKLLNMLPSTISKSGLDLQSTDLAMLFLRSLPSTVREYVTMHGLSDDYKDLKSAALKYETSQRLWAEISGSTASHYMQSMFENKTKKGEKGKGKGKEKGKDTRSTSSSPKKKAEEKSEKEKNSICFRCNRKGHFQSNCHAKTDKYGNPLSQPEKANSSDAGSKGSQQPDGKGKNKGGKGKGKGKASKGKIHELVSNQPDAESSPIEGIDRPADFEPFRCRQCTFFESIPADHVAVRTFGELGGGLRGAWVGVKSRCFSEHCGVSRVCEN